MAEENGNEKTRYLYTSFCLSFLVVHCVHEMRVLFMNISTLAALKMSLVIENKRSTAALEGMAAFYLSFPTAVAHLRRQHLSKDP